MERQSKTLAERQAAYRRTRAEAGENGERRLTAWVATGTSLALGRLARHYGATNRVVLEKLITAADEEIVSKLALDTAEWDAYFKIARKRKG